MSVAIDGSKPAWQFYKSGVVRAENNCGDAINHGAIIVGYTDEVERDCYISRWWSNCPEVDGRRRMQDASGHHNYWKLQNSWGVGWGDAGMIRLEIVDGIGICGMNRWI